MGAHYVYILHSERIEKFYIGETFNVEERLERHNAGYYEDKWSVIGRPWQVFLKIECESKSQALALEKHIKRMKSRAYIET